MIPTLIVLIRGLDFGGHYIEQRRPIDVLPERTAECVEQWLKAHPAVTVVCRDRYHEYKKGIQVGAPKATQIADRWHLLKNNSDMLQRICAGFSQELQTVADHIASLATQTDGKQLPLQPSNRQQVFDEAKKLIAEGHSDRAIAKMIPIHRSTVAKYRHLNIFPEIHPHKMHKDAPFEKYILQPQNLVA